MPEGGTGQAGLLTSRAANHPGGSLEPISGSLRALAGLMPKARDDGRVGGCPSEAVTQ